MVRKGFYFIKFTIFVDGGNIRFVGWPYFSMIFPQFAKWCPTCSTEKEPLVDAPSWIISRYLSATGAIRARTGASSTNFECF